MLTPLDDLVSPLHLYLHLPFCETKCHYCDFFSFSETKISTDQQRSIYDSILKELKLKLSFLPSSAGAPTKTADTIYFGGGTPSLLPEELVTQFFDEALKSIISPSTEVSWEANPSSVSLDKARLWTHWGVNRVSLGVQALNQQRLEWLTRPYALKDIYLALEALFESGLQHVSIDYIVGVPEQNLQHIEQELSSLLKTFPIEHVSCYLLTLREGHGKLQELPDDETQLEHLLKAHDVLSELGFEQYEISNYARPGAHSRHNSSYWSQESYWAVGPSAHGYNHEKKLRYKNWAHFQKYQEALISAPKDPGASWPLEWTETLSNKNSALEAVMLGLRTKQGLSLKKFTDLYGEDLAQTNEIFLKKCLQDQLIHWNEERIQLTTRGFFQADSIIKNLTSKSF